MATRNFEIQSVKDGPTRLEEMYGKNTRKGPDVPADGAEVDDKSNKLQQTQESQEKAQKFVKELRDREDAASKREHPTPTEILAQLGLEANRTEIQGESIVAASANETEKTNDTINTNDTLHA